MFVFQLGELVYFYFQSNKLNLQHTFESNLCLQTLIQICTLPSSFCAVEFTKVLSQLQSKHIACAVYASRLTNEALKTQPQTREREREVECVLTISGEYLRKGMHTPRSMSSCSSAVLLLLLTPCNALETAPFEAILLAVVVVEAELETLARRAFFARRSEEEGIDVRGKNRVSRRRR